MQITVAVVGFALVAAMNAVFAWLIQPLLDEGFTKRNLDVIRWIPFAVAAIFIIRSVGSFLGIYYIGRVGHLVVQELRGSMHGKLLNLPAEYYETTVAGNILSKFTFDVERGRGGKCQKSYYSGSGDIAGAVFIGANDLS